MLLMLLLLLVNEEVEDREEFLCKEVVLDNVEVLFNLESEFDLIILDLP